MTKTLLLFSLLFFSGIHSSFSQSQIIETIYFQRDSFRIEEKYLPILDQLSKKCDSDSLSYLKVFGYADSIGTESYNELISQKRAGEVYNYLLAHSKFDTKNVYVDWLGESKDVYDLHFPYDHSQQRCVDIWLMFRKK